ncbi:MAG: SurA N-terminal domain-containing protein [Candidatus Pacebacteria bacterium]|nr:SurA N-terminal domain-containing protein [Candidatus Paceibacterota bacterium]
MSKTTTKKTKKTPTRTLAKKSSAKKITKPVVKQTKPVAKKTPPTPKVSPKMAQPTMNKSMVGSVAQKSINYGEVFKKFFANQKNVIILVAAFLFLGLGYLLKDVFIVAMVNGKPIYRWTVVQKLEEQGGRQILDSIVAETLVKQAIKDAGIKIEQAEIDSAIKEIEDRIAAQGMSLDQALAEQNMTKDDLVEDIVLQKSAEKIVADKITVTDEEVMAYMEENQDFFPEDSDLESMKTLVRTQLESTKVNTEIQTWVQSLQDNAKIIYLKEYSLAL